jgi:hypothetical protein
MEIPHGQPQTATAHQQNKQLLTTDAGHWLTDAEVKLRPVVS